MQSVYSTAPADWAYNVFINRIWHLITIKGWYAKKKKKKTIKKTTNNLIWPLSGIFA